jgi:hypothetical protein
MYEYIHKYKVYQFSNFRKIPFHVIDITNSLKFESQCNSESLGSALEFCSKKCFSISLSKKYIDQ